MPPALVVTVVVPGIPLVVSRCILAHPGRDGLSPCVHECIAEEAQLSRCIDQRSSTQLHVVAPVVFLVEVRRPAGRSLTCTLMKPSEAVRSARSLTQLFGKRRIALPEHGGAQCERSRVLTSGRGVPGGPVLRLYQSLWLSGARIDRPFLSAAPPVIGRVRPWKVPEAVVAVIAKLVEHVLAAGIHPEEPVQPMSRFVEDVRNTVRSGQTVGGELVGKRTG